MSDDKLNIAIIEQNIGFPFGMASSSRIRLIARALAEQGANTSVFIMQGTEHAANIINKEKKGLYNGVYFEYMSGTVIRPDNFFIRQARKGIGFFKTFLRLWKMKKGHELDVVLLYTRRLSIIVVMSWYCRLLRVPIALELCEWPITQATAERRSYKKSARFCSNVLKYIDAVLSISSFIEERVTEYGVRTGRNIPVLKIPILADISRKLEPKKYPENSMPYLAYCGSLDYYDILKVVIDAIVLLKIRSQPVRLKILGGLSPQRDIDRIRAYIDDCGVRDIVEILGYLEDSERDAIFRSALALLAPLPDNDRSRSRFPTKIGEYLASGRPLIATNVGEIGHYLRDNESAFLVERCDPDLITEKILSVLNCPEKARLVGERGRQVALSEFHYSAHGPRLYNFFREAVESRGRIDRICIAGIETVERDGEHYYANTQFAEYLYELSLYFKEVIWIPRLVESRYYGTKVDTDRVKIIVIGKIRSSAGFLDVLGDFHSSFFLFKKIFNKRTAVIISSLNVVGLWQIVLAKKFAKYVVYYLGSDPKLTVHLKSRDIMGQFKRAGLKASFPFCVSLSDGVLARGKSVYSQCRRWNQRVIMSNSLISYERHRRAAGKKCRSGNREELRFLYVGKVDKNKGVHILIEAFERLVRDTGRQHLLTITGSGDMQDAASILADRIGIKDYVVFRGYVGDGNELIKLYSENDALIVPTIIHEGFPRVIDEAMACGTPVICSRLGGMRLEFSEDEVLFVQPGSINDLYLALKRAANEPDLLEGLRKKSLLRAVSILSVSAAEQHAGFVRLLISCSKKR